MNWLVYVFLTVCTWGLYGVFLHSGQLAMSQDEAWDFMTVVGPRLSSVGYDVRVPALSRRKATPSLRLFAETPAGSVVGAHQLSNVAWSVLFDDVEELRWTGPTRRFETLARELDGHTAGRTAADVNAGTGSARRRSRR